MYWLLDVSEQKIIGEAVRNLTLELSKIQGNLQNDQLFPFVGRKDRRKARAIVEHLSNKDELVIDPFSGSGIISYAIAEANRRLGANEWEPYTHRISAAPWRLPDSAALTSAFSVLISIVSAPLKKLYWTRCSCGADHVLDSLFYDRVPLKYKGVVEHNRLGSAGETVIFRRAHKCPRCGAETKHFDAADEAHMNVINGTAVSTRFETQLIENSRINLSKLFLKYGSLFPTRSKLALEILWGAIQSLDCDVPSRMFLEDVFLSILPQAKYKDYRSKSQDLHCPEIMLRENNLLNVFEAQFIKRRNGLQKYSFARLSTNPVSVPVTCMDYRDALSGFVENSAALVVTDPPWTEGTAYFERAQLYHPWLDYDLASDSDRLQREMVVTDAPSRRSTHTPARWWDDMGAVFSESHRVLQDLGYLALYFRPIPARQWLSNLNRLKLQARIAGFEPLLSIDVSSSDPSMRIQQSAAYVFSKDIVLLFLKLPPALSRDFHNEHDLDQYAFQVAVDLQESRRGPFSFGEWQARMADKMVSIGAGNLNLPAEVNRLYRLFQRYCDEISPGYFLPKAVTPFSDQLFDTPAVERLFTYVPHIIERLTENGSSFTYDQFLLGLAEYLENGTRSLISSVENLDIKAIIEPYAEARPGTNEFHRRALPALPEGLTRVLELEPEEFEVFIAKLLSSMGFESIAITARSGDRGVDISAIDVNGAPTVVQCKRYLKNNVGSEPVQRLHSFAVTRKAQRKILVTTSGFTAQGIDEATITGTELISGSELEKLIAQHMPKYFSEM